jgi:hypothetical protein
LGELANSGGYVATALKSYHGCVPFRGKTKAEKRKKE